LNPLASFSVSAGVARGSLPAAGAPVRVA